MLVGTIISFERLHINRVNQSSKGLGEEQIWSHEHFQRQEWTEYPHVIALEVQIIKTVSGEDMEAEVRIKAWPPRHVVGPFTGCSDLEYKHDAKQPGKVV